MKKNELIFISITWLIVTIVITYLFLDFGERIFTDPFSRDEFNFGERFVVHRTLVCVILLLIGIQTLLIFLANKFNVFKLEVSIFSATSLLSFLLSWRENNWHCYECYDSPRFWKYFILTNVVTLILVLYKILIVGHQKSKL